MDPPSVNDFELVKLIGSGHFGYVYLAKENSTGQFYALKQVDKKRYLKNNNVEHLFVERDIMARATSQWLVKLQYSFYDATSAYFIMDFLPGGDLMQLLLRSNDCFDEKTARFYLAEACQAIHALHSLNYVHRDVKPENLFFDQKGHVCLGDFGSAAKLSADGKVSAKMVVGTPEYVSPEVLLSIEQSHKPASYSVECDWWSFGVLAYEMVYGCTPFEDDSQMALFNKIMHYDKYFRFPSDSSATGTKTKDNSKANGKVSSSVSAEMKQLIRHLITAPNKRLSYAQIRSHAFFAGVHFDRIRSQKPPFVPELDGPDDTKYFPRPSSAASTTSKQQAASSESPPKITNENDTPSDKQSLGGFNFVRASSSNKITAGSGGSEGKSVERRQARGEPPEKTLLSTDSPTQFEHDCSNMIRRLQENDRMISALREEISQRVCLFEQVQLQRDMLERDVTKQMAENALLTRQVALQRRELENLERAVRHQLSDVRRQMQVRSVANSSLAQTDDSGVIDIDSLLEQLSTLREQVEVLGEEKSSLAEQLRRSETVAKERAHQATLHRQSSIRDMEGQASRLRAAESEVRELRLKLDDVRSDHAAHDRRAASELASSRAEVGRLELELADARDRAQTMTGLRSRLADAETKVVVLEQRVQRKAARLEEAERQLREKDQQLLQQQHARPVAAPRTASKTSTAVGTSPSLDQHHEWRSRQQLDKEVEQRTEQLRKEARALERERDEAKAMTTRLRKALTEAETELDSARKRGDQAKSDHLAKEQALRRELETVRLELGCAKERASAAAKIAESEEKSRDSVSRQLSVAERKLNEAHRRNVGLEKEIAEIGDEISKIEVLAAKERKVLAAERERRSVAERELAELRASSSVAQQSEASLTTALAYNLETARKRNDELLDELARLNEAKLNGEVDLRAARGRTRELETGLAELRSTLEARDGQLAASESLRADLAVRVTALEQERDEVQRRLTQTESAHSIERYRLETTIQQQIKLIDYIQSKSGGGAGGSQPCRSMPPTPSKHQQQSENKPPSSASLARRRSSSKRHEAIPLYSARLTTDQPAASVTTSLLALGPHRSDNAAFDC